MPQRSFVHGFLAWSSCILHPRLGDRFTASTDSAAVLAMRGLWDQQGTL
jgi:hypothetical protein